MVVFLVLITFIALILIDAVLIKRLAEKKARQLVGEKKSAVKVSPVEQTNDFLFHEGHTWMKVVKALVAVGLDDFTQRFLGTIDRIEAPEPGTKVTKGQKLWTVRFGDRTLSQVAPITGRIIEVNERLLKDPSLVNRSPYKEGWIVKIRPESLSGEIPELSSSSRFQKWTDLQKARFFREFFPDLGVVYGDGEELIPGAAKQIEKETWKKLAKKFFGSN